MGTAAILGDLNKIRAICVLFGGGTWAIWGGSFGEIAAFGRV